MTERISVGVNGARGRMGRVTAAGIEKRADMELAFRADRGDDLEGAIRSSGARVVVDFTVPEAVFENALAIVRAGASPVVGTTGLTPDQQAVIRDELDARSLGGIVAPNFSLGALLMMKLAEEAGRHMERCEIIELHHDGKLDSPSGTALLTAERIASPSPLVEEAADPGMPTSRGLLRDGVRIHSVRLPGLVAHQQVIFGGPGETLTISHDVRSRECFLPGIFRAIQSVIGIKGLQVGIPV